MKGTSREKKDIEGPDSKKVKTGWEDYTMNLSKGLNSNEMGQHLSYLIDAPVTVLAGIGMHNGLIFKNMGCETIKQLAEYKYFHLARALVTMAEMEEAGKRPKDSVLNVDKALVQEYESKSFGEIIEAPIHALEGLANIAESQFQAIGVHSVKDLANLKYCRQAEAIVQTAQYEHLLDNTERKVERELNRLA